jgi:hypothetical protein
MLLGFPQSIATLLTIILFYAMDFALLSRGGKEKISQQFRTFFKYQIQFEA